MKFEPVLILTQKKDIMNLFKKNALIFISIFFFAFLFHSQVSASVSEQLKQQFNQVQNEQLMIGETEIAVLKFITNFYQANQFKPAWERQGMRAVLVQAVENSDKQGLSPDDYHYNEIKRRLNQQKTLNDKQLAELDIILTDALVRLIYHQVFGKIVPDTLDPDWNFERKFLNSDPVAALNDAMQSEMSLQSLLDKTTELGDFYQGIIEALSAYRAIQQAGGWPEIPQGKVIKPGEDDPRIPVIKARLQATGDMQKDTIDANDQRYSTDAENAVIHFQRRHNLDSDGVIGNATLTQMNVPVQRRIDQIRANIERVRWVKRNLGDEFVLVNIAAYKVYYVRDNSIIWRSRAQVGTEYRKTPVFRDNIQYIDFNPTWTVPPTILTKDVLPKIKKDRGYLKQKNMSVVDSKGNIIDPSTINWAQTTARNFPYMIRQEPGPENALGRVKIMFPNKHLVYLHDTPSKRYFDKTERAFSSGCIRVENPFELVELLLKDSSKWNQARFQEILDSGKLTTVNLSETVPVLLLYFTVEKSKDGRFVFYRDIYNRDEPIIAGLAKPFHFVSPILKKE
jgi:murein L,D-transpeptidase YcbB/YkuD